MKTRLSLVILLLFALLLAACSSATGPSATSAPTEAPSVAPNVGAEEAASPTAEESYPNPQVEEPVIQPVLPSDAYPEPGEGETVTWDAAVQMILNGEVSRIAQQHDLTVTLTLRDGSTLVTNEPAIDEVLKIIEQCGDPCQAIEVMTE